MIKSSHQKEFKIVNHLIKLRAFIVVASIAGVWTSALAADLFPAPIDYMPMPILASLKLHNPLAQCRKDCAVSVYGGELVTTAMHDIFYTKHTMPWGWHYGDSTLLSGSFARPVLTYGTHVEVDLEIGVGKRFGMLHEEEIWGALYFRYKKFPWDDYVRTTVAFSTGLNYATAVPLYEMARTAGPGDNLLHYLSPELTLGLPQYPDFDFVARFHHRSGGKLGIFNNTGGGAQYGEIGFRYRL